MGHKSKKSLTRQVQEALQAKFCPGDSKHLDKHSSTGTDSKLYSYSTFRTYLNIGVKFTQFCKANYGCKTLEQCKPHLGDYIAHRESYCSAYTTKLDVSALNKIYGADIRSAKSRSRTAVTRSRGAKEMDKHFSATKNVELVSFLRSTGLRRAEATHARGSDLCECPNSPVGLGIYVRPSGSKGGRPRVAPLYCSQQTAQQIKDRCATAGNRRLFDHIHTKLDVHSLRADYALQVYSYNKREKLLPGEQYHCRNDMRGLVLDRNAMRITSNALGHNRIQVATHYLYGLQSQYSCFISSVGCDMYDGYANEEVVVFDDIRENCGLTFDQFLKTIDNHTNSRGKSRFRNKNLTFCKMVIITTTLPMNEFLHRLDPYQKEDWKQFRRRCRFYITMKEDHMIVREYDFQSDSYTNETYLENPVKELIEKTKAEPKMSPEEISMHLGIPLFSGGQPTKKKTGMKASTNPPSAFMADIPKSNDITPPPF